MSTVTGQFSEHEKVMQVTETENEELMKEVTNVEVKDVFFAMHPDKACGPDGLNPAFSGILKYCRA